EQSWPGAAERAFYWIKPFHVEPVRARFHNRRRIRRIRSARFAVEFFYRGYERSHNARGDLPSVDIEPSFFGETSERTLGEEPNVCAVQCSGVLIFKSAKQQRQTDVPYGNIRQ